MGLWSFIYKASPPTLADGAQTQPLADSAGNLKVAGSVTSTPATVGAGTAAAAARTVEASDSPVTTALGAVADAAVTNPASSASIVAALKGLLTRIGFTLTAASGVASAALRTVNSTDDPVIGATNETAPASDTATAGLNGRLQRIAQRLTSLIVQGTGAASSAQRSVLADDAGVTSVGRLMSCAATTNATNVKASAGTVFSIRGYNTAGVPKYVKLYDKATAPTVGTDVPVLVVAVPTGAPFHIEFANGRYFSTGIGYSLQGGVADADTTALAAGDIIAFHVEYR